MSTYNSDNATLRTDDTTEIEVKSTPLPFRSDKIDQIAQALSQAQGAYEVLEANQDSPNGPYANLQATLAAVKKGLSENGISFTQHTILGDEGNGPKILETVLLHSSGQWISSQERVVPGHNWRSTGNIYEVVKRIQAQMLLGIAPSDNDPISFDDNGQEQAQIQLMEDLKTPHKERKRVLEETITNEQFHDLLAELDGHPAMTENVLEAYNLETLADLPKEKYYKVRNEILRIKKAADTYKKR